MSGKITIHFDNFAGFNQPVLYQLNSEGTIEPRGQDDYGAVFEIEIGKDALTFKFGEADGEKIEDDKMYRYLLPKNAKAHREIWCRGWTPFLYVEQPAMPQSQTAGEMVDGYDFADGLFVSDTDGRFALGASLTNDGGAVFGFFHPHVARVFVTGDFNNWQHPDCENPDPDQFLEMTLHRGYFDAPNVWLRSVDEVSAGQKYKFYLEFNSIAGEGVMDSRLMVDPYARFLDEDFTNNNSLIVDPSQFDWQDGDYQTPAIHDLILYELHVNGLTHDHPTVPEAHQGKFTGIIDLIEAGYFDQLGVTCLYLMPVAESPTPQGEDALGYNTSLFLTIERDFGTPDEFRQLVNVAHQHGLAIIIDQVFNHSANSWNPLWKHIVDHPDEVVSDADGGLYFSGASPWGNRVSTERTETQNMLIDACKLMLKEYHLDGFRFDATHTNYMDHGFLHRLAGEMQAMKPDVILIAENLPNQTDLNREGYNGFGQWCDFFHDTMKAFLREGRFEGTDNYPERLGDVFYFSKGEFAAHTNNVVNYCESHDEHSIPHEISFHDALNTPQAKERKARLGLFATMVALGQPMMYMGQEFGADRERNKVYFDFPENLDEHGFFQWSSRLINLRKRYPGLKLHGFNPIADGQFNWMLGSWMDGRHGGGKRVLGWRSTPTDKADEFLAILLNFENHSVEVDIPFGTNGIWVRLASIDEVNDIPPHGTNSADDSLAICVENGVFPNFVLPDSSGFIYKWQQTV